MPKAPVTPKKITKHGNERWRVKVPARMGGGVRILKTKAEAQAIAYEFNQTNNAAGRHLMGLPESDKVRLANVVEKMGRDIGAIEIACDDYRANNRVDVPPIADCIADLLETRERQGKRKRTMDTLRVRLVKFESEFRGHNLGSISAQEIEKWAYGLKVGPRTVINYLTAVSALYTHARKRKWVTRNPIPDVNRPNIEQKPVTFLTVPQCRELLETVREHDPGMMPFFAIGLFTGARTSSVASITKRSFIDDGNAIEIQGSENKVRTRYLATVQPCLRAWLDLGGEYRPKGLRRRFEAIRDRLSFTWDESLLRHTFCTYHLAMWQSFEKTGAELDHRDSKMIRDHYRGLATRAQAQEFWEIVPG